MTPPDSALEAPADQGTPDDFDPASPYAVKDGDSVVLMGRDGKKLQVKVKAGTGRGTHLGEVDFDDIIGKPLGMPVKTRKGAVLHVLRPTLEDHVMGVKRATQIVYPKDIGPILMKLGLYDGARVIECGSGSGALTTALAWMVAPSGQVYTYDREAKHQEKAIRNIAQVGLADVVSFRARDIGPEGFDEGPVDAVFLDLKDVPSAIPHATAALHPGCVLGMLVPTMNQVSEIIYELQAGPYIDIEVLETFFRHYKINPARMRPHDRMVGHTSYLVFARRVTPAPEEAPESTPDEAVDDEAVDDEADTGSDQTEA